MAQVIGWVQVNHFGKHCICSENKWPLGGSAALCGTSANRFVAMISREPNHKRKNEKIQSNVGYLKS